MAAKVLPLNTTLLLTLILLIFSLATSTYSHSPKKPKTPKDKTCKAPIHKVRPTCNALNLGVQSQKEPCCNLLRSLANALLHNNCCKEIQKPPKQCGHGGKNPPTNCGKDHKKPPTEHCGHGKPKPRGGNGGPKLPVCGKGKKGSGKYGHRCDKVKKK